MTTRIALLVLLGSILAPAAAQFGLATTFDSPVTSEGNMLDVTTARDVVITGFDVNVSASTQTVEVWTVTAGTTFVGSEANPADWTLIDAVNVNSYGSGSESHVSLSNGIAMSAGQTLGFYVTTRGSAGAGMSYAAGADFGGAAARDATLTIHEGVGKSYPFASTYGGTSGPGGPSRIWSGRIYYDVVGALSTGFGGVTVSSGNMFDIVSTHPIRLREIDVHLISGPQTVEVYITKSGSFVGKETSPSDWTLIGSATVNGAGQGLRTTVPLLLAEPVAGTRGIYVTTTSAFAMIYGVGSNFGGTAGDDGMVQIREGVGNHYPFGTPVGGTAGTSRIWNGTLRYGTVPDTLVDEDFDSVPGNGSAAAPRGWLQDANDATGSYTDWYFRSTTPSSFNGPFTDHTSPGAGNFAHTEDSTPSDHAAVNLLTPPVRVSTTFPSLGFWVNSNDAGATQNPLAVDVIEQPSGVVHRDIVLQIGETAGLWSHVFTGLTAFAGKVVQVRFRGRTDGGSFNNDVGIDDVSVGAMAGPGGTGQSPQPGLAVLDINDAGNRFDHRGVDSILAGPYESVTHPGETLDITIESEPHRPVLFFAGPSNPALFDFGQIGKLDVGTAGLGGIVLIADGNGTGFFDALFRTDAGGSLFVALPSPSALAGSVLGFQAITFNSSPSAISLSNSVVVTVIP